MFSDSGSGPGSDPDNSDSGHERVGGVERGLTTKVWYWIESVEAVEKATRMAVKEKKKRAFLAFPSIVVRESEEERERVSRTREAMTENINK